MKLPKKIYIVAAVLAVIGIGTAFVVKPKSEPSKPTGLQQTSLVEPTDQQPAATESTSPTQQVAAPQKTQAPVESPPAATNPYPEGFNIWHAFDRRAEQGLTTPKGPESDQTYYSAIMNSAVRTPSLYAIAFGGQKYVAGVVEEIGQDGSLKLSCTNCGQWNVLTTRQITPEAAKSYFFLP